MYYNKIYNSIEAKIKKFIEHEKAQLVLANKHFQKHEKWILVVIWALAIYLVSSRQLNDFFVYFDLWHFLLRKIAHMFEFGVLAFLIFRLLSQTEKRHVYWNLFWALIFTILYAVSDEYHQFLVPGRHGVWTDVAIDSIGAFIAVWLLFLDQQHKKILKLALKKK